MKGWPATASPNPRAVIHGTVHGSCRAAIVVPRCLLVRTAKHVKCRAWLQARLRRCAALKALTGFEGSKAVIAKQARGCRLAANLAGRLASAATA